MYLFEMLFFFVCFLHIVIWTNVLWLKWPRGYNGAHLPHCPATIILPLRPLLLTENTDPANPQTVEQKKRKKKKILVGKTIKSLYVSCASSSPAVSSENKFLCWFNGESRGKKWSKCPLFPVVLIMYRKNKQMHYKSVFVFYWCPVN